MTLKTFEQKNIVLFSSVILCLLIINFALPGLLSEGLAYIILLTGFLLIGFPHGALDYELAKKIGLASDLKSKTIFLTAYTLLAAAFFGLWIIMPVIAFTIFLLFTIYHFSEDWHIKNHSLSLSLMMGTLFLALPTILHKDIVSDIFSALVPEQAALFIVEGLYYMALLLIPASFLLKIIQKDFDFFRWIQYGAFIAAGIFLHPLYFLFCYFCLFHSSRHFKELYDFLEFQTLTHAFIKITPIMVASLLAVILILFYREALFSNQNLFYSSILAIAAMTIPHMILIEYAKKTAGL
ncbi:MAG: Brp/Blh family beta-carotene 15,15'-dioxygenase [Pseudomonadota bacterium]